LAKDGEGGGFAQAAKPPQGPTASSEAAPCLGAAPAHARDHHSKRERDGWHWGRVDRAGGGGHMGWENQLPPCLVCLKSEMAAACAARGADPGHRCRPAPRRQRHLVPRAPRTAGPNLYLHKGVRGASPGRGLGLRGGAPFVGLAVHKKVVSFGSCHWLPPGLLPRTLAPRDGLHQTNSRQAPCVLNLNFSKGRQGPGRGGAMHQCGWWAHARVLRHQMKTRKRRFLPSFLCRCSVLSSPACPLPPCPEGLGAPLTSITPTRYAVCVAPPKCGTQAIRGWERGPCAGCGHCQWRFPQRPGIGTPHSTQPLSLVHMSCMHSGPRGLCAPWGGASESLSHTSGAWPTLPPVCARPKVLG
jgi:hypothetical protein